MPANVEKNSGNVLVNLSLKMNLYRLNSTELFSISETDVYLIIQHQDQKISKLLSTLVLTSPFSHSRRSERLCENTPIAPNRLRRFRCSRSMQTIEVTETIAVFI